MSITVIEKLGLLPVSVWGGREGKFSRECLKDSDGRKIKLIPDYSSIDFSLFSKMIICSESKQMHVLLIL